MGRTKQVEQKAPKSCRDCGHWAEVKSKVRIHEVLEHTISQFENKIAAKTYMPTVAEYVKLLQLERGLGGEDRPKEVTVTWVGPETMSDAER